MANESQHTLGPWHVQNDQNARLAVYAGEQSIAYCGMSNNTTEANARLIAAAPDLLAALHSILEHSKEFGDIEDYETMLVRIEDKARAAIREVEGR